MERAGCVAEHSVRIRHLLMQIRHICLCTNTHAVIPRALCPKDQNRNAHKAEAEAYDEEQRAALFVHDVLLQVQLVAVVELREGLLVDLEVAVRAGGRAVADGHEREGERVLRRQVLSADDGRRAYR